MFDVIALGELLIDFACVATDDEGYPQMAAHPGGAPANFLATLSKFGMKTAMIGKVGQDTFGELLKGTLKQYGISTEGIQMDPAVFTTLAFVTFDRHGERRFAFSRKPGADTRLRLEEVPFSLLEEARVFHYGTLSLTDEPSASATRAAVDFARQKKLIISFDPNLRMPLWKNAEYAKREMLWGLDHADVVKISDNEVDFLWRLSPMEGAKKIVEDYGVKLVYVTCGKDGCYFCNAQGNGRTASRISVEAKDTTGAGDIFGGSAMWKLLQTGRDPETLRIEEMEEIAAFACTSATLSTQRPGGIPSIFTLDEILRCL